MFVGPPPRGHIIRWSGFARGDRGDLFPIPTGMRSGRVSCACSWLNGVSARGAACFGTRAPQANRAGVARGETGRDPSAVDAGVASRAMGGAVANAALVEPVGRPKETPSDGRRQEAESRRPVIRRRQLHRLRRCSNRMPSQDTRHAGWDRSCADDWSSRCGGRGGSSESDGRIETRV